MIASDGIPDALRLHNASDVDAFRRWFTFLAEAQYYNNDKDRPTEITDCSSLLRYAYREALRQHDTAWVREARLPFVPALPSVEQYHYPRTPVGPNLFRVRGVSTRDSGDFALFADAKTLQHLNTFLLSRDLRHAQPGDLLFFRRATDAVTGHSMIYLGRSQFEGSNQTYVVYHTGPEGGHSGEIRRRSVRELLNYPEQRWRPIATNPSFAGVFRWNILGETPRP